MGFKLIVESFMGVFFGFGGLLTSTCKVSFKYLYMWKMYKLMWL